MQRRIVLSLVSLVVLLAVTELGLQLLAHVARERFSSNSESEGSGDGIRILCVGDSHTFGASIPPSGAYPVQLASRLQRRYAPRNVDVINHGFPGVNTAFVALRLEAQLAEIRPHAVIVWVGTNNRWNSLETESWDEAGPLRALDRALLRLKLYRLAKVWWIHRTAAENDSPDSHPTQGMPIERRARRLDNSEVEFGIRHDMEQMVAIARAAATPIIFLTYPLSQMNGPNAAIVSNGRRLGVPVLATAGDYARALKDGHSHTDLIIYKAGPHPTGLLYGYIAGSLAPLVADAIRDAIPPPVS